MINRADWQDLRYHGDAGVITPERAFTICELLVYRFRDGSDDPTVREAMQELAIAVQQVARSWR